MLSRDAFSQAVSAIEKNDFNRAIELIHSNPGCLSESNKDNKSLLKISLESKADNVVDAIYTVGVPVNKLEYSVRNCFEKIRKKIEANEGEIKDSDLDKALLNARDGRGNTLLHIAAREARDDVIRLLLNAGANPDIKNIAGQSYLEIPKRKRIDIESKESKSDIPKQIHFIWLGGLIPKNRLQNIYDLSALVKKSGWKITYWTDNKNTYLHSAKEFEDTLNPLLTIRDIKEVSAWMKTDSFWQENAEECRYLLTLIEREQIGLKNYAAVSDLLRAEILRKEGGYYFDSDDRFTTMQKTESRIEPDIAPLGFLMGITIDFSRRPVFAGGNDILAATPHNNFIEKILLGAIKKNNEFDHLLYEDILKIGNYAPNSERDRTDIFSTLMQIKRLPINRVSDRFDVYRVNRLGGTMYATGPHLYHEVVMSTLLNEREYMSEAESNAVCFPLKNVNFVSEFAIFSGTVCVDNYHSELTWFCQRKKSNIFFDDSEIRYAREQQKAMTEIKMERKREQPDLFKTSSQYAFFSKEFDPDDVLELVPDALDAEFSLTSLIDFANHKVQQIISVTEDTKNEFFMERMINIKHVLGQAEKYFSDQDPISIRTFFKQKLKDGISIEDAFNDDKLAEEFVQSQPSLFRFKY